MPKRLRNTKEKIEFLMAEGGIADAAAFAQRISASHNIDVRTPLGWLELEWKDGDLHPGPVHVPDHENLTKLSKFFGELLGLDPLPEEFWRYDIEQFRTTVLELRAKDRPREIRIPLARKIGRITPEHAERFAGKYMAYRYSFRDDGKIISEIISAERSELANQFKIEIHSHASLRKIDPEIFRGTMFRFGKTYYIMVSYPGVARDDRRIRLLQFPEVPQAEGLYYGIISGASLNLESPASARIIIKKFSDNPKVEAADQQRIRRNDASDPEIAEFSALIENKLTNDEYILTTDPRMLKKVSR